MLSDSCGPFNKRAGAESTPACLHCASDASGPLCPPLTSSSFGGSARNKTAWKGREGLIAASRRPFSLFQVVVVVRSPVPFGLICIFHDNVVFAQSNFIQTMMSSPLPSCWRRFVIFRSGLHECGTPRPPPAACFISSLKKAPPGFWSFIIHVHISLRSSGIFCRRESATTSSGAIYSRHRQNDMPSNWIGAKWLSLWRH